MARGLWRIARWRAWAELPWVRNLIQQVWRPESVIWILFAALLFLPVVMLKSMAAANVAQMQLQADEISTLATGIRSYYADNVIARLQAANGQAKYSDTYRDIHGAIPIPATLSIELGALFDNAHSDGRISYEFLSDYPFAKRVVEPLDPFEEQALARFRADPSLKSYRRLTGNGLGRSTYRLATPVIMRQACVTCHNAHPDSPRRDWKVGDVRGIQEVSINGLQAEGFGNLSGLFGCVGFLGLVSVGATSVFQRQSQRLSKVNRKLADANQRESALASKLSEQLRELSIFGSVVDDSIIGISIADMRKPDAPLIYVNNAFVETTGYAKNLAVGYNCRFLQGPKTDPAELNAIKQALREGKSYSGDLINYKQDGSLFWNRLTLYPLFIGDSKSPDYYVANQVDITSLKNAASFNSGSIEAIIFTAEQARSALLEADRFAAALKSSLTHSPGQATLETEAFIIADQQAHNTVRELIASIEKKLKDTQS